MKPILRVSMLLALLVLGTTPAMADADRHGGPARRGGHAGRAAPPVQFDARYHHDHYYPGRGYVVPSLPSNSVAIGYRGGNYFFHVGVWFRAVGATFVVVEPPIGIVVPMLPPAYATVWINGLPYYYANGVYYLAAPAGYTVVAPPPGAEQAAASSPMPPEPVIYPRNGQSAQQLQADRQECNRWATTQPNANDPSVFVRAFAACMDAHGYTVR